MRANDKIYVSEYLKDLNERVKGFHLDKTSVKPITCKELAKHCEVTPATITNLTTSSNFYFTHQKRYWTLIMLFIGIERGGKSLRLSMIYVELTVL